MRTNGKNGFTIVELLTVIGIILLLIGALATSLARARRNARIQQAISEAQQLTDAMIAYENFVEPGSSDSPLAAKETGGDWVEALDDESHLAFVLGKVPMPNGQEGNVPVLYNGAVTGGRIRDPWGNPYYYRIMQTGVDATDENSNASNGKRTALVIPNINRIPVDEEN